MVRRARIRLAALADERIDADILAFFRTTGRRYQTRMNEVLRTYMNAQRQSEVPRGPRGR